MAELPTIELQKGDKFTIPAEYQDTSSLTIRMPWHTEVHRGRSVTTYCRDPKKDKPYVPQDTVEFKLPHKPAKRYRVVRTKR